MVATSRHQYAFNTMMIKIDCLFVLAAVFQVIASQGFPQGLPQGPPPGFPQHKCAGPPPGVKNPHECCLVKPMYAEEELIECGFQKAEGENGHRHGPPDCSKPECLLQKKGFLNEDKSIKYDEVKGFVDEWAGSNPEFKDVVETAKSVCMGENGPPGPPQICEPNRLMFCTAAILFSECPTWQDTDECKQLKEHMDQCKAPNFPN